MEIGISVIMFYYGEIYFHENYFELMGEENGEINNFFNYTLRKRDSIHFSFVYDSTKVFKGYFEYLSNDKIIFHFYDINKWSNMI